MVKLGESFKFIIQNFKFINYRYLLSKSDWPSNNLGLFTWKNRRLSFSFEYNFFIIFRLEPTFIRIAPVFPEIKNFLQRSWSIYFLELFSKDVLNNDQVCCREQLITLTCFLFFASSFWWTLNNTFTWNNVRILLYFNLEKNIFNFVFT